MEIDSVRNGLDYLSESLSQLDQLQNECNEELASYQRENFTMHEAFRSTVARLNTMITNFEDKIYKVLDSLTLRLNHLEIMAFFSFKLVERRIIDCNGEYLTTVNDGIAVLDKLGTIKVFQNSNPVKEIAVDKCGQVTSFRSINNKLVVGFKTGMVIVYSEDGSHKLEYHTKSVDVIHCYKNYIVTGSADGLVVIWSEADYKRLMIIPTHRMSIVSLFDSNSNLWIADSIGVVTENDPATGVQITKISVGSELRQVLKVSDDSFLTFTDRILLWKNSKVIKTFNAINLDSDFTACLKTPELLVLGSKTSRKIQVIALESLLFPRSYELESQPVFITQCKSSFLFLTAGGGVISLSLY